MVTFDLSRPGALAKLGRYNGFAASLEHDGVIHRGYLDVEKGRLLTAGSHGISLAKHPGILSIPKAVEIPRNERLYCRCTPAEKEEIKRHAEERDMAISEYLLVTALNPFPQ